jgi:hypothetical protein
VLVEPGHDEYVAYVTIGNYKYPNVIDFNQNAAVEGPVKFLAFRSTKIIGFRFFSFFYLTDDNFVETFLDDFFKDRPGRIESEEDLEEIYL